MQDLRWQLKCCWREWSWGRSCPVAADCDLNHEYRTSYNTWEDIDRLGLSRHCLDKCIVKSAIYREDTRITCNKCTTQEWKEPVYSCIFTFYLKFLRWCIFQTAPQKHWRHLWGREGCGFSTESWSLCLYEWTQAVETETIKSILQTWRVLVFSLKGIKVN